MKIGILGYGATTGDIISPLINTLESLGHTIYKFPFHNYVSEVWGLQKEDTLDVDSFNIRSIYEKESLDMIIYGTGSLHKVERNVPLFAAEYGVISVSILDNALETVDNLTYRYTNRPDIVIVPNAYAKNVMVLNNIMPEKRTLTFSNVEDVGNGVNPDNDRTLITSLIVNYLDSISTRINLK